MVIKREEESYNQVPKVPAGKRPEVEILEEMRNQVNRIQEIFAPLNIPVTYTRMMPEEDS